MEGSVINQDLARWSRGGWIWAGLLVFALQAGVFWLALPPQVRTVYPTEPMLSFAPEGAGESPSEWLRLEDPMLFAAPSWEGVSALAWMRKPETMVDVAREFPPLSYLTHGESGAALKGTAAEMPARISAHVRPAAEATLPVLPAARPEPVSRFAVEGFAERTLLGAPALPVQLHSDVVSRTVVQAAIDADGQVVSSRVLNSSGSKRADADALGLARGLRFAPLRGLGERPGEIAWGKLIFEWHALDLSRTNAVRQP